MSDLENDKKSNAIQAFAPRKAITATGDISFGADDLAFRNSVDVVYTLDTLAVTILAGSVTVCKNKTFAFGAGSYTLEVM